MRYRFSIFIAATAAVILFAGCTRQANPPAAAAPVEDDNIQDTGPPDPPAQPTPPPNELVIETPVAGVAGAGGVGHETKGADVSLKIRISPDGKTIESVLDFSHRGLILAGGSEIYVKHATDLAAAIDATVSEARKNDLKVHSVANFSISAVNSDGSPTILISGSGFFRLNLAITLQDAEALARSIRDVLPVHARIISCIRLDAARKLAASKDIAGQIQRPPTNAVSINSAIGDFQKLPKGASDSVLVRFHVAAGKTTSCVQLGLPGILQGVAPIDVSRASSLAEAVDAAAEAARGGKPFKSRKVSKLIVSIGTSAADATPVVTISDGGLFGVTDTVTPDAAVEFAKLVRTGAAVHAWVAQAIDFDAMLRDP